jgi:hypothetical protein
VALHAKNHIPIDKCSMEHKLFYLLFPLLWAELIVHAPIGLPDTIRRNPMIKPAIFLGIGASALLMTAASAAPLSANVTVAPESNIQNVRMVCNEDGRCWRERGESRVIIRDRDAYGYAPRERYIERRGYYDRDYDERGGIGFSAPGVSVGIGRY